MKKTTITKEKEVELQLAIIQCLNDHSTKINKLVDCFDSLVAYLTEQGMQINLIEANAKIDLDEWAAFCQLSKSKLINVLDTSSTSVATNVCLVKH